jgi:hypothetical protein
MRVNDDLRHCFVDEVLPLPLLRVRRLVKRCFDQAFYGSDTVPVVMDHGHFLLVRTVWLLPLVYKRRYYIEAKATIQSTQMQKLEEIMTTLAQVTTVSNV